MGVKYASGDIGNKINNASIWDQFFMLLALFGIIRISFGTYN